eukprot:gene5216-8828_t
MSRKRKKSLLRTDEGIKEPFPFNINAQSIFTLLKRFTSDTHGIETKGKRIGLTKYDQCFLGSEAIEWMSQKDKEGDYSKEQILILFELFRNIGVFRNVKDSKKPFDAKDVYMFTSVIETVDGLQNVIVTNYEDILMIRKQLTSELNLQEFYADFLDGIEFIESVDINDYIDNLDSLTDCFKATSAIDWISKKYNISKQAAIYVGTIFEKYKIFVPKVTGQKPFQNSNGLFYGLMEFMDFCDSLNSIIKQIKLDQNFGIFYFDFDITEEQRNKMKDTQQFEIEPEIVMKRKNETGRLPHPFIEMLKYLKSKNIEQFEGIFRISGYAEEINDYRFRYDFGEKVDLSEVSNPHTVATLFKTYLKIMPNPVLTFELYDDLLNLTMIQDEQVMLSDLINILNTLSIERKLMLIEIMSIK